MDGMSLSHLPGTVQVGQFTHGLCVVLSLVASPVVKSQMRVFGSRGGGKCPLSKQLTERGQTGRQVGSSGKAASPRRGWLGLPLHGCTIHLPCHKLPTALNIGKLCGFSLCSGRAGLCLGLGLPCWKTTMSSATSSGDWRLWEQVHTRWEQCEKGRDETLP